MVENCSESQNIKKVVTSYCYSVWIPGKVLYSGGCLVDTAADAECEQEVCSGVKRITKTGQSVFFCCCNTTNCNKQFVFRQEEQILRVEKQVMDNHQDRLIIILCWAGGSSIIIIFVLLVCLTQQDIMQI